MPRLALLAALAFCAAPAFAAPPELAELPGPLVLTGGKEVPKDCLEAFFDLAGKEKAKIVVIPTAIATAEKDETVAEQLKPWKELKAEAVVSLHTRDPKRANDPEFVKPLTEATGVWFSNGHTDRLLQAYQGTLFEKELKKLHAKGVW